MNGKYRDTVRGDFWRRLQDAGPVRLRASPGSSDLYEHLTAGRLDRPRHRRRRLHAAGPRLPTTRSTTRRTARQPGRREPQPLVVRTEGETTDKAIVPARPPAAQLPHHPGGFAGRADDLPHGDDGHPGREQRATARTTRSSGSTGTWTTASRRWPSSRAGSSSDRDHPITAGASSSAPRSTGGGTIGEIEWFTPPASTWRRMGLEHLACPVRDDLPQRKADPGF